MTGSRAANRGSTEHHRRSGRDHGGHWGHGARL